MIVGSIKENIELEKRISLTPETAKNIIGLGLKVCIEKNYALHLGIDDKEYKDVGTRNVCGTSLPLSQKTIKKNFHFADFKHDHC